MFSLTFDTSNNKMIHMKPILIICFSFFYLSAQSQIENGATTEMHYNRLIHSAGTVITYGDPQLENHCLDIIPLAGKKFLAVEDRYGIAVIDKETNTIKDRWSFPTAATNKDLMSTYSGITAFQFKDKQYIAWGAAARGKSFIMIAEWDGEKIANVQSIKLNTVAPATMALPNQVVVQMENDIPYLLVVLNGNNQLLKIRFTDQQIVWSANTGVAPFGLCVINKKAYVTNWAGPTVTDTTKENAGTPWGRAYTNPVTGATAAGSLSIIDLTEGKLLNEVSLGLHPNAIVKSGNNKFIYIANGNSDEVSVLDVATEKIINTIKVGLFPDKNGYIGSSPNALLLDESGNTLYVANGIDNAIAVVQLGTNVGGNDKSKTMVTGYIPTEAYPSGIALVNKFLYVTNLEARGASVLSNAPNEKTDIDISNTKPLQAFTIHKQMASLSAIPVPNAVTLRTYTEEVMKLNLQDRITSTNLPARKDVLPKPMPDRIGEPSVFKHVIYIIKENKTYDQVFGDVKEGMGEERLCIYGKNVTPNQHKLAADFSLLDNYYAAGKSSAEGHQWADAAMASDYIEKNVRAWFRSYPHRQEDALVYNKNGFIWNNAMDHGKKVRVYGEACLTNYDTKLKWLPIFNKYQNGESLGLINTTTIARLRPIISPDYPDCDNINFTDQLRADVFIKEWKQFEAMSGDQLPDLMVLSLPDDHTSGTSPNFPTPRAMVADNDLAVGRIIETITHSRFWDSTVVFITEDDSQSGWDHISSYRTTGFVISPYSVMNKTIHTNYNQTSLVRSIEQILGIPPMNVIDATANPMFDCFTDKRSTYKYQSLLNNIPLTEMNKSLGSLKGKALEYAKLSANKVFKEIDGGDDDLMNKILWFDAKGNEAYPFQVKEK